MRPKKITDQFSVSGQIKPADIAAVKQLGFRSIIANRPDGEGWGQPRFEEIEKAAADAGLPARYIPISRGISESDLQEFAKAFTELPKPVLAYCRSGARSATLWSIAQNNGKVA